MRFRFMGKERGGRKVRLPIIAGVHTNHVLSPIKPGRAVCGRRDYDGQATEDLPLCQRCIYHLEESGVTDWTVETIESEEVEVHVLIRVVRDEGADHSPDLGRAVDRVAQSLRERQMSGEGSVEDGQGISLDYIFEVQG